MSTPTQDRRWEINLEVDEIGQPNDRQFEADLQTEMLKLAAIQHRLGGAVQSYVIREQDPSTGLWHPVKAVFKWQSFVPGIPAPRPQREPEAEPEVEVSPEGAAQDEPGDEPSAD